MVDLKGLTYEQAVLLKRHLEEMTKYDSPLYKAHQKKENETYQENRRKRIAKENDFNANILPCLMKWGEKNFTKGMRLRFKGARDRKGIREIFTDYVPDRAGNITCLQILVQPVHEKGTWKLLGYKDTIGQVTVHGLDKLTHIFIEDKWVKVTDLFANA